MVNRERKKKYVELLTITDSDDRWPGEDISISWVKKMEKEILSQDGKILTSITYYDPENPKLKQSKRIEFEPIDGEIFFEKDYTTDRCGDYDYSYIEFGAYRWEADEEMAERIAEEEDREKIEKAREKREAEEARKRKAEREQKERAQLEKLKKKYEKK